MTDEQRILGYLGLAARGRRIESGEDQTEKTVRNGRAHLVLIAGDASENTKKKFRNLCDYYEVPCFVFSDRATLGRTIGRRFRASCVLTDSGLAKAVIGILNRQVQA